MFKNNMISKVVGGALMVSFIGGCSLLPVKPNNDKQLQNRISKLSRQLRAKSRELNQFKDENQILRQLAGIETNQPLSQIKMDGGLKTSKAYKKSSLEKSVSEELLFLKVTEAFKLEDLSGLKRARIFLEKKNGNSELIEKSLILEGQLLTRRGTLGPALDVFNEVLKKYPKSSHKSSALLGKAQIFSKLQLHSKAKKYYRKVINDFPGTTDADKAKFEIHGLKARM